MSDKKYRNQIESLLFLWGEPLELSEIAKAIGKDKRETRRLVNDLIKEYEYRNSALEIRAVNDYYQIQTKADYDDFLKGVFKKESKKKLTNSAMETLAIIAYKQPITRIEIDNIRGVRSSSAIDSLINKKLVEEVGKLDKIGKPILYGTSDEFLLYFNINSIEELPEYEKIENIFKDYLDEDK
ncbi:MAG: SMC-Scp complex subunit ScpB [Finegoldia sp.]|nr:SMC-Scp complex subunit ScpB [Finegoldia sp.]